MRFVCYRQGGGVRYGAVQDGRIVELSSRLGDFPDIISFIANGDLEGARRIVASSESGGRGDGDIDYDDAELAPVVPNPGKIVCVGLNYREHVDEAEGAGLSLKVTSQPMIFARWPESLTGHRRPIIRPRVSETLDYEAELLAVIGRDTGRHVSEARALDYVFGYACLNEACVREYQRHSSQITPGKNFEQTGATGPWLVTADEIADPMNLDIEMRLNGVVMQHANTSRMTHSIAEIIAYVTRWMPLRPGDLIATGTMGGVGFARTPPVYLKPGDIAEVEISSIGTLRNTIEDEAA